MNDSYNVWLKNVTAGEAEELAVLNGKEMEIGERFDAELEFGTAGMRGELGLGTYRMNRYTVMRATKGLAEYVAAIGAQDNGVVIAYDTRRCSQEFALAAAAVLSAYKVKSYIFEDVRPVAFCSFAVRELNAQAGIMITASHNPKEYNGYKVYGADGAQMSPEATTRVVDYIKRSDYFGIPAVTFGYTAISGKDNYALDRYCTVIGKSIDELYYAQIESLSLSAELVKREGRNYKLVFTPIHGAGYVPVTTILNRIGITPAVVEEQKSPDADFSTVSVPNPENKEALTLGIALGRAIGANAVIGTDPDCDRMGAAIKKPDGEYFLLNGNQIGALLLDYILTRLAEQGKLPKNGAVVKTIVTTTLADKIAAEYSVAVFDVLTGFKFIGEKIKEWENGDYEFIFGYEESYGYLRGTHARDKDAVVSAMLFAEMLVYHESRGKLIYERLIELFEKYGYYYEANVSVLFKGIAAMREMADKMAALRKTTFVSFAGEQVIETRDYLLSYAKSGDVKRALREPKSDVLYYKLTDGQFLCARPSGTEPKLKLYVLATACNFAAAEDKAKRLIEDLKSQL